MAAALALIAAFCFALAATLQQRGSLNLPTISLADPKSLVRLASNVTWLVGTLVLFTGYLFQAGALDRGRLVVIQPLLVTTIVFALPLGYFLTKQHVGRREVLGAIVIVVGLVLFVYFGDPAGGNENAPNSEWLIAFAVLGIFSAALFVIGRGGDLAMKAAVYGTVAGIMFGLSSALTKPTLDYLHESVGTMLSHWECYALAIAGVGRLRPAAGVPRNGTPGAVGRDRVGREPDRRHPDRDPPPRRAPEPADLARRPRCGRARPRARRSGRDLARPRSRRGRLLAAADVPDGSIAPA